MHSGGQSPATHLAPRNDTEHAHGHALHAQAHLFIVAVVEVGDIGARRKLGEQVADRLFLLFVANQRILQKRRFFVKDSKAVRFRLYGTQHVLWYFAI